jgi:hypothetical protein
MNRPAERIDHAARTAGPFDGQFTLTFWVNDNNFLSCGHSQR